MTSHGQPDEARSSRYILKDYVSVSPWVGGVSEHMNESWVVTPQ